MIFLYKLFSFFKVKYLIYLKKKIHKIYKVNNLHIGFGVRIFNSNNVSLGDNVIIGDNVLLNADRGGKIVIGSNCAISEGVKIICWLHDLSEINFKKSVPIFKDVEIGENVWIGYNAIILPGCKIGKNCRIGAGSVVSGEFEDGKVILGNPARIIGEINK